MSTFAVTVDKVVILPHPNADALELAQVGHFRAVVAKGQYSTGDLAVFIPEQAVLPSDLIEELGLTGKLAGSEKNRVKAVRLRGELSQGIVARPSLLAGANYQTLFDNRQNLADLLGITKWVPPVPVHMAGDVQVAAAILPWVDIENIKRYPDIFTPGEPVTATEKVHGTATLYTYDYAQEQEFVSSKGLGVRRLALKETDKNVYWRMARRYRFSEFARNVANALMMADAQHALLTGTDAKPRVAYVGLFGETYGKGIQDLTYGATEPKFVLFDISVSDENRNITWLDQALVRKMVEEFAPEFSMVPELYNGPYDYDVLAALAEGKDVLSGGSNVREGVVVRPVIEGYSEVVGGRKIGKIVGGGYLTRKGGTEYE